MGVGPGIQGRSCLEPRLWILEEGRGQRFLGAVLLQCFHVSCRELCRCRSPLWVHNIVRAGDACAGRFVRGLHINLCMCLEPQCKGGRFNFPPHCCCLRGALASVIKGMFLSSGILHWNSGPCQSVPCLLTINYLIYIH